MIPIITCTICIVLYWKFYQLLSNFIHCIQCGLWISRANTNFDERVTWQRPIDFLAVYKFACVTLFLLLWQGCNKAVSGLERDTRTIYALYGQATYMLSMLMKAAEIIRLSKAFPYRRRQNESTFLMQQLNVFGQFNSNIVLYLKNIYFS